MHNAFLTVEGQKISKSLGNDIYLKNIIAKGFDPLALRYFYLQAHYRTHLSFSWNALAGAAGALERLIKFSRDIAEESGRESAPSESRDRFLAAMRDDLATPQALGILWDSLKSEEYAPEEKWGLIQDAESHLGLNLTNPSASNIVENADVPEHMRILLEQREKARLVKDFVAADRLRKEIENSGYHVDDGPNGPVLTRTTL
jgi:cysteinyl-tRNA synthetase